MGFDLARRISSTQKTIGQIYKEESDWMMEETWDNDPQSKVAYIYDFFHDDAPLKKDHMTYENTTKTKVDVKFIVTAYGSVTKDAVEFHIQFKPSMKTEFEPNDELYYFETDYRSKLRNDFPVGMFVDLPNEKGVYEKWLVVSKDDGNQFTKYSVLKCNQELMWIENDGHKKIKRRMWSVLRNQNSYNSGLWLDRYMTTVENQNKIWLPFNSITSKIYYVGENGKNMRVIVSALMEHPLTWQISKVENTNPYGIQKLTLAQTEFNQFTDYVNMETGEMYADYYSHAEEPQEETKEVVTTSDICILSASNSILKIGGSYKTITASYKDKYDNDTTKDHTNLAWSYFIGEKDMNGEVIWTTCTDEIVEKPQSDIYSMKVKFNGNLDYLGKLVKVCCTDLDDETVGEIQFELMSI